VVFPASGFPCKNLGVDVCDCCIIFIHCLILFLLHKEGKGLGLVNCELYSTKLIRLFVPSFPNKSDIRAYGLKWCLIFAQK
jgi:hypothetical protein